VQPFFAYIAEDCRNSWTKTSAAFSTRVYQIHFVMLYKFKQRCLLQLSNG